MRSPAINADYEDKPSVLLDASEFARLLSISKATLWRLRENGKLPQPIALTSQCLRWRRSEIEAWIERGCPSCG
jgi:predicted DNA-binding transcriptional regulator AlpA